MLHQSDPHINECSQPLFMHVSGSLDLETCVRAEDAVIDEWGQRMQPWDEKVGRTAR
jgi:hypothetical protein